MNELALFAGGGGGILGGLLLGWRTVCAVEIDAYARSVLLARQRDGILEPFPIWDDIRTFDGKPWRGYVDVVSGGFPCQDISPAGAGGGLSGKRSGLWYEMERIIGEVGPRYVLVENSSALATRGLGSVLGGLANMGFDARWGVLTACSVGAPHTRARMFIVADADGQHGETWVGNRNGEVPHNGSCTVWGATSRERERGYFDVRMEAEARGPRMVDGIPNRLDRCRVVGLAQVPAVVALAWRTLKP